MLCSQHLWSSVIILYFLNCSAHSLVSRHFNLTYKLYPLWLNPKVEIHLISYSTWRWTNLFLMWGLESSTFINIPIKLCLLMWRNEVKFFRRNDKIWLPNRPYCGTSKLQHKSFSLKSNDSHLDYHIIDTTMTQWCQTNYHSNFVVSFVLTF